jgi:hypothetical protein
METWHRSEVTVATLYSARKLRIGAGVVAVAVDEGADEGVVVGGI